MDAADLLKREPSVDLVRDIATVAIRHSYPKFECREYFGALDQALTSEPPPFATNAYADIYRTLSAEDRWMAVSLITNAEREGDGARRLWSLAACSIDEEHKQLLKRHACDESKHSRIYLTLVDLSFPGALAPAFRAELRQLSPGYSMGMTLFPVDGSPYAKVATIDDFLQMNIAEIRTTIHHIMQRPALAGHCPGGNSSRITMLHDQLLGDELSHVAYSAMLIEKLAQRAAPGKLADLFRRRFRNFNTITTEELGDNVFDCSLACCARRPSCRAKVDAPMAEPETQLVPLSAVMTAPR
jgi:hypothetical protein